MHEALEITWCRSSSYAVSKLTPSATVTSGSFAGAEMITLRAPASMCFDASARLRKKPGRLDDDLGAELRPTAARPGPPRRTPGSRCRRRRARRRRRSTLPGNGPYTVSCRNRWTSVSSAHQVVQPDPLDVEPALVRRTEGGAARPPEPVDRNADSHGSSFVGYSPTLGARAPSGIGANADRCCARITDARGCGARRSRATSSSTRPPAIPAMTIRSLVCAVAGCHGRNRDAHARSARRAVAPPAPQRRRARPRRPPAPAACPRTRCALGSGLPPRDDAVAVRHHDQQPALVEEEELLAEEARVRLRLAPQRGNGAEVERLRDHARP